MTWGCEGMTFARWGDCGCGHPPLSLRSRAPFVARKGTNDREQPDGPGRRLGPEHVRLLWVPAFAGLSGGSAYESRKRTRRLEEMGIGNAVMHRANKHHPVLADDKRARNAEISKKRMPAEGVFGYFKRTLGYRKVRYTGLAKGETELLLKSMAYNIVRSVGLSDRPARA